MSQTDMYMSSKNMQKYMSSKNMQKSQRDMYKSREICIYPKETNYYSGREQIGLETSKKRLKKIGRISREHGKRWLEESI